MRKLAVWCIFLSTLCVNGGNCGEELDAKKQEQIRLVDQWTPDKPKDEVARAIGSLGDEKATAAIPVLVKQVTFQFSSRNGVYFASGDDYIPLTEYALAVAALRKIGVPALTAVLDRLAELDDEDANFREVYFLRQVLLGISERDALSKALSARIQQTTDAKAKARLDATREKVATLLKDD